MRSPSKTITIACNSLFLVGVLAAGRGEAAGIWWTAVLVTAAMLVILALAVRDGRRWPTRAAYCGVAAQFLNCTGVWVYSFYVTSQLSPPMEATLTGGLAAISLLALVNYRPLYLAPWMSGRAMRRSLVCAVAVGCLFTGVTLTGLIYRISTQSKTAQLFVRVGGGVHWQNGWVVRLDLKGSGTTNDDLPFLQALPQLHELCLANTLVTDRGLVHLRSLTQLQKLQLPRRRVSPESVIWLKGELPRVDIQTL